MPPPPIPSSAVNFPFALTNCSLSTNGAHLANLRRNAATKEPERKDQGGHAWHARLAHAMLWEEEHTVRGACLGPTDLSWLRE